ncbi:MAG: hypothetical protein ACK6AT_03740, partial [Planctomycetota bacterium]
MTGNPSDDDLKEEFDEILLEFLRKHDAGQPVDRQEFLSKYPEYRQQLEGFLETADWIEQMAGPTLGDLTPEETSAPSVLADPPEDKSLGSP